MGIQTYEFGPPPSSEPYWTKKAFRALECHIMALLGFFRKLAKQLRMIKNLPKTRWTQGPPKHARKWGKMVPNTHTIVLSLVTCREKYSVSSPGSGPTGLTECVTHVERASLHLLEAIERVFLSSPASLHFKRLPDMTERHFWLHSEVLGWSQPTDLIIHEFWYLWGVQKQISHGYWGPDNPPSRHWLLDPTPKRILVSQGWDVPEAES